MKETGWHAIINGKIKPKRRKVINRLLQHFQINASTSTYQGQVTELVENVGNCEGIISIGGDGTLSEVINGINLDRQKILVAPAGTINCFARFIGVWKVEEGISLIERGEPQKVDLLSIDIQFQDGSREKRFVWGFITLGRLVRITTLASKFSMLPKIIRYSLSTVMNHAINKKTDVNISVNGEAPERRRFSSLILNNATASHFSSIPFWDMQDGTSELQIVNHNLVTQFIASFSRFIKLPVNFSWINGIRSLSCEFDDPVNIMADGEILWNIKKFDVKMIKESCEVQLPVGMEMHYKIPGFTGKWKQFNEECPIKE